MTGVFERFMRVRVEARGVLVRFFCEFESFSQFTPRSGHGWYTVVDYGVYNSTFKFLCLLLAIKMSMNGIG